jgi:RHH-type transcriptional regulator, rel operon repressor / antitoxin RelB
MCTSDYAEPKHVHDHDSPPRRRHQGSPRRLAEATQRSKSFLAAEAIRAYVENNEWQIGEILAALKEAGAGDFASEKDVTALAKKWKVNAG